MNPQHKDILDLRQQAIDQKAVHSKLGAWLTDGGAHFMVWAPKCRSVEVVSEDKKVILSLKSEPKGYFSGFIPNVREGFLYKLRVDGKDSYPDPCSRFQPKGPHGPSMVISSDFEWHDSAWQNKGIQLHGQIVYEVHIGTFSEEGTFSGLMRELPELKKLGITLIEIMPIAEFPGRWNWGYDGVGLYAPSHTYGTPEDLKHLVDYAHSLGIAVILDVVYNHFGPDGNYLRVFSDDYFAPQHKTDWGEAINFDGRNCLESRKFFVQNACYWIEEFHLDGLRLDATQNIYDQSKFHILAEISKRTREIAWPKQIILIGENESQDTKLITSMEKGGYGLDALWNDDFHHTARVALTGRREAYYTDYLGRAQEFISLLKYGYLYQGQFYSWQDQNRGTFVCDELPAKSFVIYLQNHDQVANSLYGHRMTHETDLSVCRALTAFSLLAPQTPLIFMGQEFGATTPFVFFTDHHAQLGEDVFKGRKEFLAQFPSIALSQETVADPNNELAFISSKLKFEERQKNKAIYQLYSDLLKIRREHEVFNRQDRRLIDGAVLSENAFAIRYKHPQSDVLLIVNLGNDLDFSPCSEPLLAPSPQKTWTLFWSSDDVKYEGKGPVSAFTKKGWFIPGRCAQILISKTI